MRGQIAADPALALEKLESGEFDDVFAPGARDVLAGEAWTTARVRGAEAAAAARERHATRREYAFMTDAEIEADLEAYAPGGGPRDTDERDEAGGRREVAGTS